MADRVRVPDAGGPTRVLVVSGFGYELSLLAEWMEQCPGLFAQCDVTVRPNPVSSPAEHKAALDRLSAVAPVTVTSQAPLAAQIADADVVLFCVTTAVAEAMWAGRLAVYVELSDLWTANPLQGGADPDDAVPRCATPDDLKRTLARIAAMDGAAYERAVTAQRQVAERLYSPFDIDAFRGLAMGDRLS